jgi:hypothetical protein
MKKIASVLLIGKVTNFSHTLQKHSPFYDGKDSTRATVGAKTQNSVRFDQARLAQQGFEEANLATELPRQNKRR